MVQSRYGWQDDVILNLPYARFMDIVETISEMREREQTEEYRKVAFGAYLRGSGQSEEEEVTFQMYLDRLQLSDDAIAEKKAEEDIDASELTKEEAIAKAESILKGFNWGSG